MRILMIAVLYLLIVNLTFGQNNTFYKFSSSQITSLGKPTSDSGFIFTGSQFSNMNSYDLALMKMDKNGNPKWGHIYHSGGFETVKSHITLKNGGFLITGSTYGGSATFNLAIATNSLGIPVFSKMYGNGCLNSAVQTNDNNIILGGYEYNANSVNILHLYKISPDGSLIWVKSIDSCYISSIIEAKNGNIMVTGFTKKNDPKGDMYLSCFDSNGNLLWTKQYGTAFSDEAYYLIQTNDGGFGLFGYICYGGLHYKAILIKTNSSGTVEWAKQFKSTHPYTRQIDLPNGILQNSDGTYTLEINASLSYPYSASTLFLKIDANNKKYWSWDYQLGGFDFSLLNDSGFLLSCSNGMFIKANKNGLPGCEQREGLIAINDTTITAADINFIPYVSTGSTDFYNETDTLTTVVTDKFVPATIPNIESNGPMNFCQGGQVTLTLNPPANTGYIFGEWDLRQLIYVDTTTTLYARSVTTSGCTARSRDTSVIVFPLPKAKIHAIGDTSFCYGDSAHLVVETHPGYKYEWVPGNSTDTVFYPKFGWNPFVCLITDSNKCFKSSNGIQIVMHNQPYPQISYTKTSFCSGDSTKLYTVDKWDVYHWSLNDTLINGASSDTLWAKKRGLYRAIVTNEYNCTGKSFSEYIIENSNPVPIIWTNGNVFSVSQNYSNYLWFKDNVPTGNTQQDYSASSPGSAYYVQVMDINGCKGRSADLLFTAIPNKNSNPINIYPNPAKNNIHLKIPSKYINSEVQLKDISGRVIFAKTIKKDLVELNVTSMRPGVYILQINDFLQRIVIE